MEYIWAYTIYDQEEKHLLKKRVWHDSTWTKWGARFAAKRALRKLRKGKTQFDSVKPEVFYG